MEARVISHSCQRLPKMLFSLLTNCFFWLCDSIYVHLPCCQIHLCIFFVSLIIDVFWGLFFVCTPTLKNLRTIEIQLNHTRTEIYIKWQHAWKIQDQSLVRIMDKVHWKLAFWLHFLMPYFEVSKCLTCFLALELWVPEKHIETGRDWSCIQLGSTSYLPQWKCLRLLAAKGKSLSAS